jgi:hypothetical protein
MADVMTPPKMMIPSTTVRLIPASPKNDPNDLDDSNDPNVSNDPNDQRAN